MLLLAASVTLYVLVIISGLDPPSLESLTNTTIGLAVQLSASSVTTVLSDAGTSPIHSTVTAAGLLAVGSSLSSIVTSKLQVAVNPDASVTTKVLVVGS